MGGGTFFLIVHGVGMGAGGDTTASAAQTKSPGIRYPRKVARARKQETRGTGLQPFRTKRPR